MNKENCFQGELLVKAVSRYSLLQVATLENAILSLLTHRVFRFLQINAQYYYISNIIVFFFFVFLIFTLFLVLYTLSIKRDINGKPSIDFRIRDFIFGCICRKKRRTIYIWKEILYNRNWFVLKRRTMSHTRRQNKSKSKECGERNVPRSRRKGKKIALVIRICWQKDLTRTSRKGSLYKRVDKRE